MFKTYRLVKLATAVFIGFSTLAIAQQTATTGTFVLHKFAKAIGTETYSIEAKDGSYTLTSHFKFTDRGTERLYVLLSDQPLDVEAARRAARASFERARGDVLRMPALELPGEQFQRTDRLWQR